MSTPKSASGRTPSSPTTTASTFNNKTRTTTVSLPSPEDNVVESPSLSSSNALARFEFEPGRSRDGTKILMVEWEDDDTTRAINGDWAVSWEGKKTVLPARDTAEGEINRLYFLLPPGERVPATVTLTLADTTTTTTQTKDNQRSEIVWTTNPLPAIFPPELGASAREAGKKGVLHTIWGKKRLQVLAKEIKAESQQNVEGIALQMALQEREWIEQNFGITTKPTSLDIPTPGAGAAGGSLASPLGPTSPASPRSPGGGRLMEKLKGLRLETRDNELRPSGSGAAAAVAAGRDGVQAQQPSFNPLSPEQSDVAVSSFGSFAALKGAPDPAVLAAKSPQRNNTTASKMSAWASNKKITAQRPPESVLQQQRQAGMASLNAFAGGHAGFAPPAAAAAASTADNARDNDEREDDLFALPMSPRSPDMSKIPFSFGSEDTIRYLSGERV